jgi:phosphoglycolate phosphatase
MTDLNRSPIDSVVFDIDGTLLDSLGDIADALNAVLADAGLPAMADAAVRPLIGGSIESTVERAFAGAGRPLDSADLSCAADEFLTRYRANIAVRSVLYPETRETLEALRDAGYGLGVCSNKPHDALIEALDAFALTRFFQAVVGAGAADALKPDPAPYFQVLRGLGGRADASVLVGDSETDVKTARNAAAKVVLVPWGYTRRPAHALGADAVVERLSELPDWLTGLS